MIMMQKIGPNPLNGVSPIFFVIISSLLHHNITNLIYQITML